MGFMWLLADITRTGMLLAGMALLIFVLMRRSFRYYGSRRTKRKVDEPYMVQTPRPVDRQRSLSTAPPDLLRWHVEMQETARDMKAELDSKMRLLQLLIAQARHEADRLQQLRTHGDAPPAAMSEDRPSELASDELASGAQRSGPSPRDNEQAGGLPGSAAARSAIFALADQGQSAASIARQIGTPVGEVELILSLRRE